MGRQGCVLGHNGARLSRVAGISDLSHRRGGRLRIRSRLPAAPSNRARRHRQAAGGDHHPAAWAGAAQGMGYVGAGITWVMATIAHYSSGEGPGVWAAPDAPGAVDRFLCNEACEPPAGSRRPCAHGVTSIRRKKIVGFSSGPPSPGRVRALLIRSQGCYDHRRQGLDHSGASGIRRRAYPHRTPAMTRTAACGT